jgi:thiol-disulfide isomerase/thioredoxin
MKNFIHIFLAVFSILIAFPFTNIYGLEVGDKAPNLIGYNATDDSRLNLYRLMTKMTFKTDENGALVKKNGKFVKEFINFVLVLNFYSKTCIPCLKEIPTYNKVASRFKGKKVRFLYINVDPNPTKQQIEKLINQYNISIPIMMVNQKEAFRKYNADILPRLFIIDKKKRVNKIISGFSEQLEAEIVETLDELL